MPYCYQKIKDRYDSLSASAKKAADFIIENPNEVVRMPISQLADKCNTSKATIVRFCQELGYSGYKDFCIDLNKDVAINIHNNPQYKSIDPYSDIRSTISTLKGNVLKCISNTLEMLDVEATSSAVDLISNAKRIDIYGIGTSGVFAMDAYQRLLKLGRMCCICETDIYTQKLTIKTLQKNDVVLIISYSGETARIIQLIQLIRQTEATVISITKSSDNTIAKMVDINLYTVFDDDFVRIGAMSSHFGHLAVIDTIITLVANRLHLDSELLLANPNAK